MVTIAGPIASDTIERSMPERLLDEKIRACNVAAEKHREHKQDPWAKFRASLSMGRGIRSTTI